MRVQRGTWNSSRMFGREEKGQPIPCVSSNFFFGRPDVFPFPVVSSPEDEMGRSSSRAGSGRLAASAVFAHLCSLSFSVCHPQVILPELESPVWATALWEGPCGDFPLSNQASYLQPPLQLSSSHSLPTL